MDRAEFYFKGIENFPYIEELLNEFHIKYSKVWRRPTGKYDWYVDGDWVIVKTCPIEELINQYELVYVVPYGDKANTVKFLQYLSDTHIANTAFLEGCLREC